VWAGTGSADDSVPAGGCNGYGSGAMVVHRSGPMPHDPGPSTGASSRNPTGIPCGRTARGGHGPPTPVPPARRPVVCPRAHRCGVRGRRV